MECFRPRYLSQRDITVPCGKCGCCLATRRSDWASRIDSEWRVHWKCSFVTLTYADAHLRWRNGVSQLEKRDLQLFFKKVRKSGIKFRYYAVGEYGSKTFRPHYHILFFGDVPEAQIRKSWGLGLVHVGNVTRASISYTLKYIVNSKGPQMRNGRAVPFCVMSRRPGLGINYLTPQMKEWHGVGGPFVRYKNYMLIDGQKRHLPRFYKLKIWPSKLDQLRITHTAGKASMVNAAKRLRALSPKFVTLSVICVIRIGERKCESAISLAKI